MLPFAVFANRLPVFGLTKMRQSDRPGLQCARLDPGRQTGAKTVGLAGAHAHTYRTPMLQGGCKPKVTVHGSSKRCKNRLTPLGSLFEPRRQSLVTQSNFVQFQADVGVVHGLGSDQEFFGTRPKVAGEQSKLRIPIPHRSPLS